MTDKLREVVQQDIRCECCGYMTHHREHLGCIRAALAQQDAQAVPLPEHETEAMHDAVMAVMYKGVTRTNTNALWQAYRCAILNSALTPPAQRGMLTKEGPK